MAWRYGWDAGKRRSNLAKHGLDFAAVVGIFDDPDYLERPSARQSPEARREVIGRIGEMSFFVVYTQRGDVRRLISARRASRQERRAYDESLRRS